MANLRGKAALITGASKGIGAAAARALASEGVSVTLVARSEEAIKKLATDINADGGQATFKVCDVSQYAEVEAAVKHCVTSFGSIDILVNNAGVIDPIARLADSEPDAWSQAFDINLKGVYFSLRATLPLMLEKGDGIVVNISSGAATSALEGWSHYCSSKAGALMLTKAAHKEYHDKGIRVVGLSPGTVATDMQVAIKASGVNPVSELDWSDHIPPEWVGQAIVFLCSAGGEAFAGTDFSLKTDEGRQLVGLPQT